MPLYFSCDRESVGVKNVQIYIMSMIHGLPPDISEKLRKDRGGQDLVPLVGQYLNPAVFGALDRSDPIRSNLEVFCKTNEDMLYNER
jgi:hypothetical protein